MDNTLIKYGYIVDDTYKPQDSDIVWSFQRYNQDGTTTEYTGIETTRNITSNKVVIIGNNLEFRDWLSQYAPTALNR